MPRTSRAAARPSVPLGSLTQPGARGGVECAACGSARVTKIAMALTDGSPVDFVSCHACEHRAWSDEAGALLPVANVLDKARKRV